MSILVDSHPCWAGIIAGLIATMAGLLTGALAKNALLQLFGLAMTVAALVGAAKQASPWDANGAATAGDTFSVRGRRRTWWTLGTVVA